MPPAPAFRQRRAAFHRQRGSGDQVGTTPLWRKASLLVVWLLGTMPGVFSASVPAHATEPPAQAQAAATLEQITFFETKIRPVLAQHCYRCHGPTKEWNGLRLDSRERMLKGGDLGPAVVPGAPGESLILAALSHDPELDLKMPPDQPPLDQAIVEDFKLWISQGAPWPAEPQPPADAPTDQPHWAFQPIVKPTVPTRPGQSPIDALIERQLASQGLVPAPRADKRTLIRRATFDLTGLPPTPEEIDAFLADESPDAFAKLVDRLLASPRYGEKWARYWLDVARYADTKGYVFQEERRYPYAYTYRDYVVEAFNRDVPIDRFFVEQIAADRLVKPDSGNNRALAALGFLTVGRRFLNNQHDIIDDRIDVISRGMLGLTVACARCHDHKYDPISTAEYYGWYGVLSSSFEPDDLPILDATNTSDLAQRADYERQFAEQRQRVSNRVEEIRQAKLKDLRDRAGLYFRAALDIDFNPNHDRLDATARARQLSPELLRQVADRGGRCLDAAAQDETHPLAGLVALVDGLKARRCADPADAPRTLDDALAQQVPTWAGDLFADRAAITTLEQVRDRLGEAVQNLANRAETDQADEATRAAWDVLRVQPDGPFNISPDQTHAVFNRAEREEVRRLEQRIAVIQAEHPGAPARAMVLVDKPDPGDARILIRGNPGRPGDPVPRRFLSILAGPNAPPFRDGSGRLELARAIVDPANPLTARVFVNRVWAWRFGTGLVDTPSDFGMRSEPPSHPELLDFLAASFIESGWSLKTLHRAMMLTETYQRAPVHPDPKACEAADPDNRLLWRFPRRRLLFEEMRDALLAVAGRLDDTIGGKPVSIVSQPFSTRRTLYGFIDRQNLEGIYRTFDLPDPNISAARRFVTTVPQQALALMNGPFLIEQARYLAGTLDPNAPVEDRIRYLSRCVLGREPTPRELDLAVAFVTRHDESTAERDDPRGPWRYGFGALNNATYAPAIRTARFEELPHFDADASAWRLGSDYPLNGDYLMLNAQGGHVGPTRDRSAIRRWIAPTDGLFLINGVLKHSSNQGDGVRGQVVSSRLGRLGEWTVHNGEVRTRLPVVVVLKGDTLDFVVDCRDGHAFDAFEWAPVIRRMPGKLGLWDAARDFRGPQPPPADLWTQYVQVLMMSNEFHFID